MGAPPPDAAAPAAPRRAFGGLLVGAAALAWKAKALLVLLKFGSLLTTFGSMGVWIWAYSMRFGWPLATGFALSILVHEMGHVVRAVRHGISASAPMFIPFLGALITVKEMPADPTIESDIGAGGPVAGALAAAVCGIVALATGSPFWAYLAFLGCSVNLFNLAPVWFLDGARIATVFSPGNWDFALLALLLVAIKLPSFPLWGMLILLGGVRLFRKNWGRHHLALPAVRVRMVLIYLALIFSLSFGLNHFRPARYPASNRTGMTMRGAPAVEPPGRAPERRRRVLSPERQAQLRPVLRGVATVGSLGLALFCWLLTPFLLFKAARERMDARGWLLACGMLGLLGLILAGGWTFGFRSVGWLLVAYVVASLAALVCAAYRAAHGKTPGSTYAGLSWHCLAVTALAALVMAYWTNSLLVLAAVLLTTAVFYARRPWLFFSLLARIYEAAGRVEEALRLRMRALELRPEVAAVPGLWRSIAVGNLTLARGGPALAALDAMREAQGQQSGDVTVGAGRAAALTYQDRVDEALRQCEGILRIPASGVQAQLQLAVVRELLAGLALFRGWPDEARAQADMLERDVPRALARFSRAMTAAAYRTRARALALEDRLDEAEVACVRSLEWDRTGPAETIVSLIRGQIALKRGEKERAEKETASAYKRLPGNLEVQYWRACALRALGRAEEAQALFRGLAGSYPGEHWGRRAAAELG